MLGPKVHVSPCHQTGCAGRCPTIGLSALLLGDQCTLVIWRKWWSSLDVRAAKTLPPAHSWVGLGRGPNEWIILTNSIWSAGQKLDNFLCWRKICVHLVREMELLEMSLWHPKTGWHCFATSLHLWGQLQCRGQETGWVSLWRCRAEGFFSQK